MTGLTGNRMVGKACIVTRAMQGVAVADDMSAPERPLRHGASGFRSTGPGLPEAQQPQFILYSAFDLVKQTQPQKQRQSCNLPSRALSCLLQAMKADTSSRLTV